MPAFKGAEARRISEAVNDPLILLKYPVSVIRGKLLLIGSIVSFMDLEDYCDLHRLTLYSLDGPVELALPHERTDLG